jgi:NAD(P)-dependent dehydrogenase (short-subunit alcohol dehydrogenase family)
MSYLEKFSVEGQVCVVTGGGGALGGTIARELGDAGSRVVILDLIEEHAQKAASSITARGGQAIALACDVLDEASVRQALDVTMKTYGTPTALINAAGGNHPSGSTDCEYYAPDEKGKTFLDLPLDGMRRTFDLNYFGTVIPTQVFSKPMLDARCGSIINFGSVSALNPLTKVVSYSSAKAAVVNFTKWLAVHYAHSGVRVNALAPGFVMTEQLRFLHVDANGEYTPRAKSVIAHTPMGRYAENDELVGAVFWLLSEASRFVTGSVISIDGGFSSFSI